MVKKVKTKKQTKSKAKLSKNRKKPVPQHLIEAAESRSALSATVAWSLSLVSTLAAEALGFVCELYSKFVEEIEVLQVLGAIMLFVALIAGVITLLLTPLVLALSKQRPPLVIVQTAVVAGALPIVVIAAQYFAR